ncbi:uncharacterized protein LOC144054061 [Vanacampus margaritifer]
MAAQLDAQSLHWQAKKKKRRRPLPLPLSLPLRPSWKIPDASMTFSYRMTERDIRKLIQLRASNGAIFTGQRHSAMRGWRAIRQELGLERMVSARQLKKKWDNLKEKYRVLKNPPAGMERPGPPSWRWFQLMDEAASGRLAASAKVLQPSALRDAQDHRETRFTFGDLAAHASEPEVVAVAHVLSVDVSEASGHEKMDLATEAGPHLHPHNVASYATVMPDGLAADAAHSDEAEAPSCGSPADHKRTRQDLERADLEREWAALERDRAALERDRAALERDRAALERDRARLDRDRAFLGRDRAFLERDRALLERARPVLTESKEMADGASPGKDVTLRSELCQNLMAVDIGPEQLESTQRLVSLFSKLVDKL